MTPNDRNWFQGTADAVRQYCWILEDNKNKNLEDIVILSGDHLYRMDYMQFVEAHRMTDADITVGCIPCDPERASDFGLMKIDDTGRVVEFSEKPKGDALKAMQVDTTVLGLSAEEAQEKPYIASMGIYGERMVWVYFCCFRFYGCRGVACGQSVRRRVARSCLVLAEYHRCESTCVVAHPSPQCSRRRSWWSCSRASCRGPWTLVGRSSPRRPRWA